MQALPHPPNSKGQPMSFISNGAYKGVRVITNTICRQHEFFDNITIKGGHKIGEVLTLGFKEQAITTSRFDLFKLRTRAGVKAITSIPKAIHKGVKQLFTRSNKNKAQETVSH